MACINKPILLRNVDGLEDCLLDCQLRGGQFKNPRTEVFSRFLYKLSSSTVDLYHAIISTVDIISCYCVCSYQILLSYQLQMSYTIMSIVDIISCQCIICNCHILILLSCLAIMSIVDIISQYCIICNCHVMLLLCQLQISYNTIIIMPMARFLIAFTTKAACAKCN